MQFPNLAGQDLTLVDTTCEKELVQAGIECRKFECLRSLDTEVRSSIIGEFNQWVFTRHWRYWECRGAGIPLEPAMELHRLFGNVVRVEGHCGCPSPLEWNHGLATGFYHVDSDEGLKALVDTIVQCMEIAKTKTFPEPEWKKNR